MRSFFALLVALVACSPPAEIPEPSEWSVTWFVDPELGDDANDGRSEKSPLRSLARFDATGPARLVVSANSRVLLRRGTALRLTATVHLHGHDRGWVTLGAWGEPTAPRPIVLGSAPLSATDWSAPDADGVRTLDWAPWLDGHDGRSLDGVEQGPGQLWFFDSDAPAARLTSWGWRRREPVGAQSERGDFWYDAAKRELRLKWPDPAPAFTEAALNRVMLTPTGQSHLIVEDLDLRYGGNYAIQGHAVKHLRLRRVDLSFLGGGTKSRVDGVDQYVRLGNGFEISGDGEDLVVEQCRVHQAFDTGFDPQFVGATNVAVRDLVFRDNLVSYPGLAGFELWLRPDAPFTSTLERVVVTNNTVLSAGRGWGYEQHDHAGTSKIGAAFFVNASRGTALEVTIERNVVVAPRVVIATDFHPQTQPWFTALRFDSNLWSGVTRPAVVLFKGSAGAIEADLTGSSVFDDLSAWQQNDEVPGQDAKSVEGEAGFDAPIDPPNEDLAWLRSLSADDPLRPTRLGPFALRGDYRRSKATVGVGWGASLGPER